jgi:hypothetical protein
VPVNVRVVDGFGRAPNLKLTDRSCERLSRERFTRVLRLPVTGRPRVAKIIVYDYDPDLAGSEMQPAK